MSSTLCSLRAGLACFGNVLSALSNLHSAVSVLVVNRGVIGSSLSVSRSFTTTGGIVQLSVIQYGHLGSSIPVRLFARFGSGISVESILYFELILGDPGRLYSSFFYFVSHWS